MTQTTEQALRSALQDFIHAMAAFEGDTQLGLRKLDEALKEAHQALAAPSQPVEDWSDAELRKIGDGIGCGCGKCLNRLRKNLTAINAVRAPRHETGETK